MKVKYRVKIVTLRNGTKEYYPQVKQGLKWIGCYNTQDGEYWRCRINTETLNEARECINRDFENIQNNYNSRVVKVDVEYITKELK